MKRFYSKLLLFGEYGLLVGGKALAVPFKKYSGMLTFSKATRSDKQSAAGLKQFADWLESHNVNEKLNITLDLQLLRHDLKGGICFNSSIPLQYGVGSSGALCAALLDRYGIFNVEINPIQLKNDFAVLESFFHGKSSGLDPMVSYLNKPVLLDEGKISLPELDQEQQMWSVYLIDTGYPSATSPLVNIFVEKMKNDEFANRFRDEFLPANNGAVESFLQHNSASLFKNLQAITQFQLEHLREMIPQSFRNRIEDYYRQGIYIKLLGSGGGGFLLAFVPENVPLPAMNERFFLASDS